MQRRAFLSTAFAALLAAALAAAIRRTIMRIRSIHPDGNAFAAACEVTDASRLLFVSGQVPEDEKGTVPPDYKSQYRLAWANVERQLKAAGMSFDNLVKANIYLSDRSLIAQSEGLRKAILGDRNPAITIILCGIYDEAWLLEIEAVAAA
jgi:enamine deaminase RidA (YjgF/YER057c/UK114 family)